MAVTYSATPLATYRSLLAAALVSIGAAGSQTVTLVHRLGASPNEVRCTLRSVITNTSGFQLTPQVTSWNASQVLIDFGSTVNGNVAGALAALFDVVCEFTTTPVQ